MKVKMTETLRGSPNGIAIFVYEEGKTYDLPDDLGELFVKNGSAIEVKDKKAAPKTKAHTKAPENKKRN